MRGALVGFGQVAENAHVPAFRESPQFSICAVADQSPARLTAARSCLPGVRTYPTCEALLAAEADLDFVAIATPPFLHGAAALAALKRGCHVLCEKPLTLSLEELASLRRQAAAASRIVYTVHNWAYSPQWRKIFALADSGVLGRISRVELRVLRAAPAASVMPGDWRQDISLAGGGILVDHGWHNLYLLHRLLGESSSPPILETFHLSPSGTEDEVSLSLKFPSAAAKLFLTWRAPSRSNWARVEGSRASLELKDDLLILMPEKGPPQTFSFPEKLSAGSAHPQWFKALLLDFEIAAANPAADQTNFAQASFCLNVTLQAYRSCAAA